MTKTFRVLSLLAAAALISMAASADASLAVTNAAALDGNFGLEVIFDGTVSKAYVEDQTPSDETTYNAEFKLAAEGPGGYVIAVADDASSRHEVMAGRNPANLIRIEIHCRATFGGSPNCGAATNGQWRAKAYVRRDNNTWKFCGQAGFQPQAGTLWGIEWVQGTGGADGSIRFLKNGTEVRLCNNIDNDDRGINAARIGAVNRVDAGTSGTSYMDSFVSTR
jgi:hypothetical protein